MHLNLQQQMMHLAGFVDHIVAGMLVVVVGMTVVPVGTVVVVVVGMTVDPVGIVDLVAVGTVPEWVVSGFVSISGKQVRRYLGTIVQRMDLGSISGQQTIKSNTFRLFNVQ